MKEKVNILVIDDHPAVREGTKAILEAEPGVQVTCLNPPYTEEAFEKIDFTPFDAILMDLNLGEINGIQLSKTILNMEHSCKVILYTGYDVADYFEEAIAIGIHGAISKTESKERLLSFIRHSINGDIIVPYQYFKKMLFHKQSKVVETHSINNVFNDREKAILQEVEKGLTNQEIADNLHLSKRSIEYSLTSIFNKLNVSTRTEAVLIAKAEGIIE
ncbi:MULTISPECIES: response regulator transcription factor [Metabacillus]|jgi:two-component system, NarL family, competent response regulator ComA|uniref:DNA-binding response regulator n=3 Tax=Metabacillus TaxID=2675233 RepID=A0A179SZ44_9BACI|nr:MULTISPECIES: response regulator transcription factor [Metabacillus]OAS87116.1 DNA-binding response regulator [Metabacillus litoralis]QNF26863.1 response regulator transcription factor [Metabacillus sp. KUDC1714]